MTKPSSDIAFTPSVKAFQTARGSREAYAKQEARGGFNTVIDEHLAEFLTEIDTAYLATSNAAGQPYAQHRGGPKGFIRVIDAQTIGFADYAGNRQYVSTGNLADNDRAFLFLMDYAGRTRLKIYARVESVALEADAALTRLVTVPGYKARLERIFRVQLEAFDWNCPQHITPRFTQEEVAEAVRQLRERLSDLEKETADLRARLASQDAAS